MCQCSVGAVLTAINLLMGRLVRVVTLNKKNQATTLRLFAMPIKPTIPVANNHTAAGFGTVVVSVSSNSTQTKYLSSCLFSLSGVGPVFFHTLVQILY